MKITKKIVNRDEAKESITNIESDFNYKQLKDETKTCQHEDFKKVALIFYFAEDDKIDRIEKYSVLSDNMIYKIFEEKEKVNLNGCYLKDFNLKNYNYDEINQSLEIENAFIDGDITFSNLNFEKSVAFNGSVFNEDVLFEDVIFKNDFHLQKVKVLNCIKFQETIFKGFSFFRDTIFMDQVDFLDSVFKKDSFFSRCDFIGEVNFLFSFFSQKMIIKNITFNNSKKISSLKNKMNIYNLASKSYENYNRENADNYFYKYMKNRRKLRMHKEKKDLKNVKKNLIKGIKKIPIMLSIFIEWILGDFLMKYGTSWKKIFFWVLTIILIFSGVYYFGEGIKPINNDQSLSFLDSLYFSMITFTTLGYGDILPVTGIFKFITAFQSFLGAILMALFIAVFSRKYMR